MKSKLRERFFDENLVNEELEESKIVRISGSSSYFTYSPFLDTELNFLEKDNKSIKFQRCIRYVNKLDLTNPLAINYQETCTIQNYHIENQSKFIKSILDVFCKTYKLSNQNLVVRAHSAVTDIVKDLNIKRYFLSEDCEFNATLPLNGNHYYLKIFYRYFDQEVAIINFVIVNLVGVESQLDSIMYLERIGFINEGKRYIYEQNKYSPFYSSIKMLKDYQIHRIINDTITILTIFEQNIMIGNKGVNSELKRKIKGLAKFIFFNCSDFHYKEYYQNLLALDDVHFNTDHIQLLMNEIDIQIRWILKLEKELKAGKYDKYEEEVLHDRFGIPEEFFLKDDKEKMYAKSRAMRYCFRDL
ncbi:hypothetical protein [Listeria kieliensis]|uniref:Uncharacterized protein n=1 Tax=Listeria kieliensis TaxID=1621700 RepID=A0A3D8TRB6_9LIST|nr:hypothetical protein [Listeria kieliensis]RDX01325.1 hypothetical protein UR08_10425 [Listeria kieliensis]